MPSGVSNPCHVWGIAKRLSNQITASCSTLRLQLPPDPGEFARVNDEIVVIKEETVSPTLNRPSRGGREVSGVKSSPNRSSGCLNHVISSGYLCSVPISGQPWVREEVGD